MAVPKKRRGYRCDKPIDIDKNQRIRPQFERMISDLNVAKRHWDIPLLRDYSRVLLYQVGRIADTESGDPCRTSVVLKWPEPFYDPEPINQIEHAALLFDHA